MPRRRIFALIFGGVAILLLAALNAQATAVKTSSGVDLDEFMRGSTPLIPAAQVPTYPPEMSIADETCLACHSQPNLSMKLDDGTDVGLYVPEEVYQKSIHGEQGYACVQCHTAVGNYPHPPFSAADSRDRSLKLNLVCSRCHADKFELTNDSVHARALEAGNRSAAVCTDCHGSHAVQRLTDPTSGELTPAARQWIPLTCANCHFEIYQKYADSIHGSALLEYGNPDTPTCIDCHGVHNIEDPTTAAFRLRSPDICAKCHTDPAIMDQYGISTRVLDTYVADFHGTTVTLFEKQHPDQETNKPVCYDCHGIHDIQRTDDPQSGLQLKENLLARCQVCHPNASENFPSAWLSHYIPSPERYPLVFTVDIFYKIFIPSVLGGMAVLVALDIGSIVRKRVTRKGLPPQVVGAQVFEVKPAGDTPAVPEPDQVDLVVTEPNVAEPEAAEPARLEDEPQPAETEKPPAEEPGQEPSEESPYG